MITLWHTRTSRSVRQMTTCACSREFVSLSQTLGSVNSSSWTWKSPFVVSVTKTFFNVTQNNFFSCHSAWLSIHTCAFIYIFLTWYQKKSYFRMWLHLTSHQTLKSQLQTILYLYNYIYCVSYFCYLVSKKLHVLL